MSRSVCVDHEDGDIKARHLRQGPADREGFRHRARRFFPPNPSCTVLVLEYLEPRGVIRVAEGLASFWESGTVDGRNH